MNGIAVSFSASGYDLVGIRSHRNASASVVQQVTAVSQAGSIIQTGSGQAVQVVQASSGQAMVLNAGTVLTTNAGSNTTTLVHPGGGQMHQKVRIT